jgi:7,8-dihydropterin-6-yl-methyl-4-(beta-D-ribofuranosyl)aminobenzene 5'-phosphate synthase
MCDSPADPQQVATAVPRPASGSAVDPIALEPVDEIVITTLVDNVYDALLTGDRRTTRAPFSLGRVPAPQFETGSTTAGLMAEHGFSALVSVRRGTTTTTLLFDTGLSPDAMVTNADRLGVDLPLSSSAACLLPTRRGPVRSGSMTLWSLTIKLSSQMYGVMVSWC